jgi:N6-L-threonylcarbamoyladenine synthase
MIVLGIETSCDECSIALVEDGRRIISNEIATQIELHKPWYGVVPEIASRLHVQWIDGVREKALATAGLTLADVDGIAVTARPGLMGSLMVGLSYGKGLAWSLGKPMIGVNHVKAHLYAPHLEYDIEYPYLGVIVSGGHTMICRVEGFDEIEVLGTTVDDACGEAFDKVAKFYDLGYPGGVAIDKLAQSGDDRAFNFPLPNLHKGGHEYDVSYSGLKTAVINQLEQFRADGAEASVENIAASFQKRAVDMLIKKITLAVKNTGLKRIVAGGGVSANSRFRRSLSALPGTEAFFPSLTLCGDNGAMIAGLGYHYLERGESSPLNESTQARISGYRNI